MEIRFSTIISNIQDYVLATNDERVMFDWLVFNCSFHLKGYRHTIPQIQLETRVARYSQEKIFQKFSEIGFLKVTNTMYRNSRYRTFFIDFGMLANKKILCQILEPGSALFENNQVVFSDLAKVQYEELHPF